MDMRWIYNEIEANLTKKKRTEIWVKTLSEKIAYANIKIEKKNADKSMEAFIRNYYRRNDIPPNQGI